RGCIRLERSAARPGDRARHGPQSTTAPSNGQWRADQPIDSSRGRVVLHKPFESESFAKRVYRSAHAEHVLAASERWGEELDPRTTRACRGGSQGDAARSCRSRTATTAKRDYAARRYLRSVPVHQEGA